MSTRVVFSDNGVLSDLSSRLNKFNASTASVVYTTGEDAFYIGSALPFARKFFEVSTPNTTPAVPVISYWDGNQWRSVVDTQDDTSPLSTPLAQSGLLSWTTDKNYGWHDEDTVDAAGIERVTGLGDITIYDLYWLRITWSANLTFTLKWVGDLFLDSDDLLQAEYPDLNSGFMSAFETGKTSWYEQRVLATKLITSDLIAKGMIQDSAQIMDWRWLELACISKTAQLIYSTSGPNFLESAQMAAQQYAARIDKNLINVDVNKNAREDKDERVGFRYTRLVR